MIEPHPMRFPRFLPRLHLRTLLIAVAGVALVLGGWTMWERRKECLELAGVWESLIRASRPIDGDKERVALSRRSRAAWYREEIRRRTDLEPFRAAELRREAEKLERRAEELEAELANERLWLSRMTRLAREYRHVAGHPWLPLPREVE